MSRPDLFGADIAGAIFEALGGEVLDATLTRTSPGTRVPGALTGGQTSGASVTSYACKGFTDEYRDQEIDGTNVKSGDRKIILLGKSLPDAIDPASGDTITIEGRVWRIAGRVLRDPAGATFTCQVRQ